MFIYTYAFMLVYMYVIMQLCLDVPERNTIPFGSDYWAILNEKTSLDREGDMLFFLYL